jgi:poly(hydroxyalkanoate) depolymerase family esterase
MNTNNETGTTPAAQWIEGFFDAGGPVHAVRRRRGPLAYRLYLPSNAREDQRALLVMLHGCKQNALSFAEGTQMNRVADEHGFAVLYPEQSGAANPWRCWNWFDPATLERDGEADLIARLIDHITVGHSIDRARVWVAGISAGAAMARILAVRHASLFAACAVHSGVMYRASRGVIQALATLRKGSRLTQEAALRLAEQDVQGHLPFVPTLVIHGDRDPVVNPVNGRQIVEQAKLLAARERPGAETLSGPHEHRTSANSRSYTQRDFSRGGAVLIREIVVEGLAHAWSGGDERHPFNDAAGPSAARLIWDFASLHRRQDLSAPVRECALGEETRDAADRFHARGRPFGSPISLLLNVWGFRRRS